MRKPSSPKARISGRQRSRKNKARLANLSVSLYFVFDGNKKNRPFGRFFYYHLSSDDTVNFLRPRRRRAANTRRPFGVDMRSRKPCLLRRLRCDGWNVLFISRDFYISVFWECKGSKIDFIYKIFFTFLYKSPALFQRTGHLSMKISAIGAQNLFSSCALPWL